MRNLSEGSLREESTEIFKKKYIDYFTSDKFVEDLASQLDSPDISQSYKRDIKNSLNDLVRLRQIAVGYGMLFYDSSFRAMMNKFRPDFKMLEEPGISTPKSRQVNELSDIVLELEKLQQPHHVVIAKLKVQKYLGLTFHQKVTEDELYKSIRTVFQKPESFLSNLAALIKNYHQFITHISRLTSEKYVLNDHYVSTFYKVLEHNLEELGFKIAEDIYGKDFNRLFFISSKRSGSA